MTANKVYYPSYIGGRIKAVQLTVQNTSESTITCMPTNGIYYCFDGQDYQLLSLGSEQIASGATDIISKEVKTELIPTEDVKIMIDTAGMTGAVVKAQIVWEV